MSSLISKGAASSLSYHDISNYFSLPHSDAANGLGVCVTFLMKICRENGLDGGHIGSIEDIKKHAAREKSKELTELTKVARQSGFQPQNSEMSKLQAITTPPNLQQQGNKNVSVGQPHILLNANMTKGIMAVDEFIYGFPSDGLSTSTTYKWWGSSSSAGYGIIQGGGAETAEEDKHQFEEKADDDDASTISGNEKSENGNTESNIDHRGLTTVRKRIVVEGREALKLGVYKSYGIKKLGRKERVLLHRLFKSSLPKEWIYDS